MRCLCSSSGAVGIRWSRREGIPEPAVLARGKRRQLLLPDIATLRLTTRRIHEEMRNVLEFDVVRVD